MCAVNILKTPSLPLTRYPIVSTGEPDEAAEVISQFQVPVRIEKITDPSRFHLDMNGRRLKQMYFGFNKYGADTVITPGRMENALGIVLGLDYVRPSLFEIDDERVQVSANSAVVISPGQYGRIWRPGGSSACIIATSPSILADRYTQVFEKSPPQRDIRFSKKVNLTTGLGRQLQSMTNELAKELNRTEKDSKVSLIVPILEEAIIGLVLGLPSNLNADVTEETCPESSPRMVLRAEEYLAAHAAEPISMSELVSICGCSQSALFLAFRSSRGYTPMQFLASRRLDHARQKVLQEPAETTLTNIALDCGFSNYGRFVKAYRRQFGETPSASRSRLCGSSHR